MKIRTNSAEETADVGARLAEKLLSKGEKRAYVALFGEMGVGKTAFTSGFCGALGVTGVRSPTYTVVNEYRRGCVPVYHFDFYRVEDEDDLASIGFEDYLRAGGFCLSEWSENFRECIPQNAVRVTITRTDGENGREIEIIGEEL